MKSIYLIAIILLSANITLAQDKAVVIDTATLNLEMTIGDFIKMYNIDTTNCIISEGHPFKVTGIVTELKDSTKVYVRIKTFEVTDIEYGIFNVLLNKKIIGIGLAYTNCRKYILGSGLVLKKLENSYCTKIQ